MMIKKALRYSLEKKAGVVLGILFVGLIFVPRIYWQIGGSWLISTPSVESLHLCLQYWENVRQMGVLRYGASYWPESGYLQPRQYIIRGFRAYRFSKIYEFASWVLLSALTVSVLGNWLREGMEMDRLNGQTR